ncbi:hypothetical protein TOPB45_0855 [Thermodesulfobacterium geofontis OPF15]|uniref:DUF488 domain-containing protein n=1 Tax=Thermodesulfobacterium geofontis (strain OPF15) TaxID=795359 RepID=F8C4H7_THEGP|nr:DUF488 domain-containing protein [Thermodesulfobacterium geofontis]AEH22953.1 hypothetical protein TOPB45_0855 [Thermodesulfobacterium geofontis OPF15]
MIIYTLGTSNRSEEEFLEILKFYQIKAIADVRRWPTSQRFPHFKKENLIKILFENSISYYHLEDLGGYRIENYENYMKTSNFKSALEKLIEIAKNDLTCIICAEKFPWRCHRRFIAKALEEKEIEVLHIIEKGKIWKPKTISIPLISFQKQ